MKYKREYGRLLRHSHLLRASMNLAHDRHQQLQQTLNALGFSEMPRDSESITLVQVQAANEVGGVRTRMLLDAPGEIEKYHFGPLQISLCLLSAMLDEYARLTGIDPVFSDDAIDSFQELNRQLLQSLDDLRDSILHERFDNADVQMQFVSSQAGDPVGLAIEGERRFQRYLQLLKVKLQGEE